jgi:hypothetical protein
MTKVRGVTGGGYDGKNVVHTNNPKREPISRPVSVGAVSRLGSMVGEGTPLKSLYANYNPVRASNPIGPSDNMGQGPGAMRTVMRAGSQSKSVTRPMPKGRDLFK